jgi:uncharacterized protein YwgA
VDKLQLALLTQWAQNAGLGGIRGRKRMQKVVYFLQQAGCPIEAEFSLHHYGPYSRDVAEVTDIMVGQQLLQEQNGVQFTYTLSPQTAELIDSARARSPQKSGPFEVYRDMAVSLLDQDLWHLELGSTVLYFFKAQGADANWEKALAEACEYKKVSTSATASKSALELAKRFGVAVP